MTNSESSEKFKGFLFVNVSTEVFVHFVEFCIQFIFSWFLPSDFQHDFSKEFVSLFLVQRPTLVTIIDSPDVVDLFLEIDIDITFPLLCQEPFLFASLKCRF